MVRSAFRVLAVVVVAAGLRRDLDDGERLFLFFVAPDGDGELAALDELLDEDFVVVLERFSERLLEVFALFDDVDADGRAL